MHHCWPYPTHLHHGHHGAHCAQAPPCSVCRELILRQPKADDFAKHVLAGAVVLPHRGHGGIHVQQLTRFFPEGVSQGNKDNEQ